MYQRCRRLHRGTAIGLAVLGLVPGCPFDSDAPPTGLALIRVSEVMGACPLDVDPQYGITRIPTDLPFRRAKATASFQASARYLGGHYVAIGYRDDDGRLGLIQYEVPPDRGYGIAEYPNATLVQAAGFAEWNASGALEFAGRTVAGYFNYVPGQEGSSDLPGKIYSHVAFDSTDAGGSPVCRIVAVHASAERERVTPFDPSWLVPRPGLLITSENDALVPPVLDDLSPPGSALVAPTDAPPDPGEPAPPMSKRGPFEFPGGSGGGSPCD